MFLSLALSRLLIGDRPKKIAMTSETSIKLTSQVSEHKQQRYDRQLRLWGDHGQKALEQAHVCLLNATATGTEILKSLVLPGIGSFTIIDGAKTSGKDTGSNFFLDSKQIGKPRAEVACKLLKELNPQVRGNWKEESCSQLLRNDMSILENFTLVIGTDLPEKLAKELGEHLWQRDIPFVLCRSYGLLAYLRVCVREHTVIESHPENRFHDMRLDGVFPELAKWAEKTDLDTLGHKEHSHTPYLLLLMKALEKWRKQTDKTFPHTYGEKKEIKVILDSMRQPDEKGRMDEENFEEAKNAVNLALHKTEVPSAITGILLDPCANVDSNSCVFWLLVSALKQFVSDHKVLPVRGTLPDMFADSNSYVQLQEIFHTKARQDAAEVYETVQKTLKRLGLPSGTISIERTQLFCKNASFLRVVRGRSLREELADFGPAADVASTGDEHFAWYVLIRACERFYAEKERYPGTNGIPTELDKIDLGNRVRDILKEWDCEKFEATVDGKLVEEMCRYGASELHPVASVLGGIAAQAAIKLITHQYVPLDNTYIFDGHTCNAAVYKL